MLSLLQAYRGFAALIVVLYHAQVIVISYWGEAAWLHTFEFGRAGVQFFFVLSGFIIYYIHRGDVGAGIGQVRPYLAKRIVRVYPVYLLVTLALAPFWLLVPSFGEPYHKSVSGLVLSMLLIPQPNYPHLTVAWTLVHEMMFYIIFALLILSRGGGRIALGVWFVAILFTNLALGWDLPFPASYFLSVNNLLFGLGMLAAHLVMTRALPLGTVTFLAANLLFLGIGAVCDQFPGLPPPEQAFLVLGFGAASFLIVLHATQARLNGFFQRSRLLMLLGDASYSIYLIHFPAMSLACKVASFFGLSPPKPLAFLAVSAFGVIGGVMLHLLIEKPLLGYFRGRLAPHRVARA